MAETEFKYDVFISYSHKDKTWVRGTLLPKLKELRLKVWIDFENLPIGASVLTTIETALMESRKVCLVLTEDYLKSEWTTFENLIPQTKHPTNKKLQIIPILLEKCELPPRFSALYYVNFIDKDEFVDPWEQLLKACGVETKTESKKKIRHKAKLSEPVPTKKDVYHLGTINTDNAIQDFVDMLHPDNPKRIMHIWGESMMGKSHLTKEVFPDIAKAFYSDVIIIRVEFTGFEVNETELMLRIRNSFHNPEADCLAFNREHGNFVKKMSETAIEQSNAQDYRQQRNELSKSMTSALVDDIRRHNETSFVLLFDAVNEITGEIREWLLRQFISYLCQLKNVRIVVTSKEQLTLSQVYSNLCHIYPLELIRKPEPYVEYCQRQGIPIEIEQVQTLMYAAGFRPGQFRTLVFAFQKSKEGIKE